MVNGNALLPEDVTTIIAKFSSNAGGAPGLWGTALGAELRQWMVKHGRPLLWADQENGKTHHCCWHLGCILPRAPATIVRTGPMLIDPVVAAQLPHFSHSSLITADEKNRFEALWAKGVPSPTSLGSQDPSDFDRYTTRLSLESGLETGFGRSRIVRTGWLPS